MKQIIGILIVLLLIGCTTEMQTTQTVGTDDMTQEVTYVDVNAEKAKMLIETMPELIVIDVSPHWAEGHLPRAVNYYPASALKEAIPTLDPEAT